MKVYLASTFAKKEQMRIYASILRSNGHTVTAKWIDETTEDNGIPGVIESQILLDRANATMDLECVDEAELVLFFSEPPGSAYARGGRHVEFGYALAKGKQVISIGYRENIFHALDKVLFVPNFQAALECVNYYLFNR